ncbi:MAG: TolC family protein [Mariniblastus sp.]
MNNSKIALLSSLLYVLICVLNQGQSLGQAGGTETGGLPISSKAQNNSPTAKRMRAALNRKGVKRPFVYPSPKLSSRPSRANPASHRLVAELKRQQDNRSRKSPGIADPQPAFPMDDDPTDESFGSVIEPPKAPTAELASPPANEPFTPDTTQATLEFFEQKGIQNHPTLNALVAQIRATQQEGVQAGLAPNPKLGLFIDEMGNENDTGLWGAYLQRNVIRGNKLGLSREIKNREAVVIEHELGEQVLRVKTDIRTAFYQLLIAQQKYELAYQLYESQKNAIEKSKQLFEAGETPKTDLIQTELQAQKTLVLLRQSEVAIRNLWRELAVAVGQPDLEYRIITGELDPIMQPVTYEFCLSQVMSKSPELLKANAEVLRAQASTNRQVAETVPNYQTQLTLGRDAATDHFFTGVQLQIPIQVNNRNQGNIAAANFRVAEAQSNVEKIKLRLAKKLAVEFRQYESALQTSSLYASQLLPKSQDALEQLTRGYPEEVDILQILTAQQQVIDITTEFLDSLNQVWSSRIRIEGLLLDDSLNQ